MGEQQNIPESPLLEQKSDISSGPLNPSSGETIGKIGTGLIVGFLTAGLMSVIVFMLGTETFINEAQPLLPFVLILTAFVCILIGNVMVMGAYNLFFGNLYYDFKKMFGLVLVSSGILFFFFVVVYIMANGRGETTLFVVLAFHTVFSIFIAYTMMDFMTNPKYAAASLLGNAVGFALCIISYLIVYNATKTSPRSTQIYYLMLFPSVAGYTLIPLANTLWQKVYRGFYEMGNDFLYIPTVQEAMESEEMVQDEEKEKNDINVEV